MGFLGGGGYPQYLFLQEATPTATSQGQLWVKLSTNILYQADSSLNWQPVISQYPTAPITSESGAYTTTSATPDLIRTYTIGGISGLGYKLVLFTAEITAIGSGATAFFDIKRSDRLLINSDVFAASPNSMISIIAPVQNADTIKVFGRVTALGTASLTNIKIFSEDARITATGS